MTTLHCLSQPKGITSTALSMRLLGLTSTSFNSFTFDSAILSHTRPINGLTVTRLFFGTFFTLWLTLAGIKSGMEPDVAAGQAGMRFAMIMTAALIWAPIMGVLNDRMDRVKAMALAMGLAAIGYTSVAFIPDPFGVWMYPAGVLLGIGQISAVTASQTLIGQEAPPGYRGSVVGMFSMFGAAGILFISSIGGWIFDRISPVAPFVLIGIANAILCFAALAIARRPAPQLSDTDTI